MLKTACINPELMKALSLCGHGDKILIADGNYPLASKTGDATKVYLGLTKDIPKVTDVLKIVRQEINLEQVEVMAPEGDVPPIFQEFREILNGIELKSLKRFDFYDACCDRIVRLAISTGETRTFANILLTVGVT